MQVVVDTNILVKAFIDDELDHICLLMKFRNHNSLIFVLDSENKIVEEYQRNLSKNVLFQKWFKETGKNINVNYFSGKIESCTKAELLNLGFHEPSDHVFVALALEADKILVTEDSDFGMGNNNRAQEPEKQRVKNYLTNTLLITLHDAPSARNL